MDRQSPVSPYSTNVPKVLADCMIVSLTLLRRSPSGGYPAFSDSTARACKSRVCHRAPAHPCTFLSACLTKVLMRESPHPHDAYTPRLQCDCVCMCARACASVRARAPVRVRVAEIPSGVSRRRHRLSLSQLGCPMRRVQAVCIVTCIHHLKF